MRPFRLTAFLALAAASPAVAGDLVVLESDVAALPPGAVARADFAVTLAPGERIVAIDEDGTVRAAKGPFSGPLGRAMNGAAPPAPASVGAAGGDRSEVIGAVRAPAWEVDDNGLGGKEPDR